MSQQINLYQPIFRRERKVFSAATIAQATLVVAAGLAAIYGYASWKMRGLNREVAMLEALCRELNCQPGDILVWDPDEAAESDDEEDGQAVAAE